MMDMSIVSGAFDLFAGLTPGEVETLGQQNLFFNFVYLVACIWLNSVLTKP